MQLSLGIEEYVVFDLETTGLSPWAGDEMIEIGAIKIYGNEIDKTNIFHTLVNPERPISEEAAKVNGITNDMVKMAPKISDIFPKFLDFIGDSQLIAQNAKFDMGFITKYLIKFNIRKKIEVYDTISFSKRVFPSEPRHNLDVIANRLGLMIEPLERHRSLGDVMLTAKAFLILKDRLGENIPNPDKYNV